jgi:hypothetical protein
MEDTFITLGNLLASCGSDKKVKANLKKQKNGKTTVYDIVKFIKP